MKFTRFLALGVLFSFWQSNVIFCTYMAVFTFLINHVFVIISDWLAAQSIHVSDGREYTGVITL